MEENFGVAPAEWRVSLAYEKLINGICGWRRPSPIDLFRSIFGESRAILSSEPRFRVTDNDSK
jgi:hypothetical protein